jgi:hypothetical protein
LHLANPSVSRGVILGGAIVGNISLADAFSSFSKKLVFIGAPFALRRYSCRWRTTPRQLGFALQKLFRLPDKSSVRRVLTILIEELKKSDRSAMKQSRAVWLLSTRAAKKN